MSSRRSILSAAPDVARIIADPVKAAQVVAHFVHPDPAFWLHEAGLAGMLVELHGERICTLAPEGSDDQLTFLDVWLHAADGRKGLKRLLEKRRADGILPVSF